MKGLPLVLAPVLAGGLLAAAPSAPPARSLKGKVTYRTGPQRAARPDIGAKVWLFRGKQALALDSSAHLSAFEKSYPRGVERVEDRRVEDEARRAAMVLTTFDWLHREVLAGTTRAAEDGGFLLRVPAPGTYTLLVESQAATGSYHMKRYAARLVRIGSGQLPPVQVDFGASHLEGHPAPQRP